MRVYLDANFFISGFSERPNDVFVIKDAAEKAGMELWVSRQIFQELRWYLRRTVEQMILIEETLTKDIKSFMESINKPESSLPQPNDMSLVLAAMRTKGSKVVTSDMKLITTIQDLDVNVEGIVGSAFVLELMESIDDDTLKKELSKIRERIYSEEVKYSISRMESYDPVTRIRMIEDHALRVLRTVKRPAEELDRRITKGQPLFVLDFLEDIKADIPKMFDDFKEGRYDVLANEIEAIQNEIERLLIMSTLTNDSETHQTLVEHASDLTLFLYYLESMCHLYRGTKEGVEDSLSVSDEAFRLLMFTGISNEELKASVFMVRIVLALIREDYDEIDYYYGLYDSLLERAGLEDMKETSEGIYITMQILRKFMGGFSLTKTKLQHPTQTVALLNDVSKYCLQFDDQDNAWQLSVNAYKIAVAYGREDGAEASFQMLYKISSSSRDRLKPALEKIAEHALRSFVKKGWSTASVTPILNEVQGNIPPLDIKIPNKPISVSEMPDELQGWMDILTNVKISGTDYLIVRNAKLQIRIGIDIASHPDLRNLRTGYKVALAKGKFLVANADKASINKHSIILLISPEEDSEISIEGEYGFSSLKMAKPEAEA